MPRYVLPIFALLAIGVLVPVFQNSDTTAKAQAPGEKPKDPASYIVGLNIGSQLRSNGFTTQDLAPADMMLGLLDALAGAEARLSEDELKTAAEALEAKLAARAMDMVKQIKTKSREFLEDNKRKDGVQVLPSGLQYVELKKGSGAQPKQTSMVKVLYEGKLIDGTVFDASLDREKPTAFRVNQVIPGWTEGLQRMRVGDKWRLYIPAELAYNDQPPQGSPIRPGDALVFDVELLDVQ